MPKSFKKETPNLLPFHLELVPPLLLKLPVEVKVCLTVAAAQDAPAEEEKEEAKEESDDDMGFGLFD